MSSTSSAKAPMPARRTLLLGLGLCCVGLMVTGCQREQSATRKLRSGPVGSVVGELQLLPGAQLPQYASLDLARHPLHSDSQPPPPAECAAAEQAARTPVTLTPEGLLRGVVVAASDFTRVRERKPQQHRIAIEHCRLQPAIIAAQGGDTLRLDNRDSYPFEPLIGPAYAARPLPRGEPLAVPLIAAGIDSVQCSPGAPCGRTDILVFFHPVYAVSDEQGRFRIDNFPAAELVRVTAWHPLFEPSETFVWVDPGQQTTIKLQLTPKARFVPHEPVSQ